jgi:hypothetical protein
MEDKKQTDPDSATHAQLLDGLRRTIITCCVNARTADDARAIAELTLAYVAVIEQGWAP